MSLIRSLVAASLSFTQEDLEAARKSSIAPGAAGSMYFDTPKRAALRAMLDGAGLAGALVKVAFYKRDGELRHMLCQPVPGADATARYVTVQDLELSEQMGGPAYRRVNLEAVVSLEVTFRAAGMH